jgi:hypothetical protein
MDQLDAPGSINIGRIWLRALWGVFPVVVRVHSGACLATTGAVPYVRFTASQNPSVGYTFTAPASLRAGA